MLTELGVLERVFISLPLAAPPAGPSCHYHVTIVSQFALSRPRGLLKMSGGFMVMGMGLIVMGRGLPIRLCLAASHLGRDRSRVRHLPFSWYRDNLNGIFLDGRAVTCTAK